MKKKTRCYIYTRVSTAIQVDGYSLDAQKDKLRKYAEFQNMEIVGEYSDEGHSGKNIKGRQEFMRMLNDIEDGKDGVDFVLVFKLSRFGRNAADVLSSLQLMQDYGVNLICVEHGIDSSKEAGKLLISIIAAVAEMERENIRVQTMAGREQKAREGKWNGGFAPYGYKLENGERCAFCPKYYLFIRAYLGKRSEAAGTFVVIFQIESIHILLSKDIICNGIIWPTGEISREVVATTNV